MAFARDWKKWDRRSGPAVVDEVKWKECEVLWLKRAGPHRAPTKKIHSS